MMTDLKVSLMTNVLIKLKYPHFQYLVSIIFVQLRLSKLLKATVKNSSNQLFSRSFLWEYHIFLPLYHIILSCQWILSTEANSNDFEIVS